MITSRLVTAYETIVSKEVWSRVYADWIFIFVSWIMGASPMVGIVKGIVRSNWGDESVVTVADRKPGMIVSRFARGGDCNRMFPLGPWSFDSCPSVLKLWTPAEN
ncbi:hypothetical protein QQ045_028419 [Rhodiola kirilowii]